MTRLIFLLTITLLPWREVDAQCPDNGKMKFPEVIVKKTKELNTTFKKYKNVEVSLLFKIYGEEQQLPCDSIKKMLELFDLSAREIFSGKDVDAPRFSDSENDQIENLYFMVENEIEKLTSDEIKIKNKNLNISLENSERWATVWRNVSAILAVIIISKYLIAKSREYRRSQLSPSLTESQANKHDDYSDENDILKTKLGDLRSEIGKLQVEISDLKTTASNQETSARNQDKLLKDHKRVESDLRGKISELEDKLAVLQKNQSMKNHHDVDKDNEFAILKSKEDILDTSAEKLGTLDEQQYDLSSIFFLSTPSIIDGKAIFNDKRDKTYNPLNSYYRFSIILNTRDAEANFEVADLNENGINNAIQYFDIYLDPACNYNSLKRDTKSIITKIPGRAIKTGDKWVVIEKALIEFA